MKQTQNTEDKMKEKLMWQTFPHRLYFRMEDYVHHPENLQIQLWPKKNDYSFLVTSWVTDSVQTVPKRK